MAFDRRAPEPRLVHHSDQGAQYVSLAFGQKARAAGDRTIDGLQGRLLRQRRRRELLRDAEERADPPQSMANQSRAERRDLRVHRGLLQSSATTHTSRAALSERLREDHTLTKSNEGKGCIVNRVHRSGGTPPSYSMARQATSPAWSGPCLTAKDSRNLTPSNRGQITPSAKAGPLQVSETVARGSDRRSASLIQEVPDMPVDQLGMLLGDPVRGALD